MRLMSDRDNAPAGWYDDGSGTGNQRYWDGQQWTEQAQESTTTVVSSDEVPTTAKPHVLGWIALAVAVLGFIFACMPGAAIVGWILLPIAFVLSIVALFLKGKKWPAIAALIVSIVGTIVAVVVFMTVVVTSVDEAFEDISIDPTVVAEDPAEPEPSFAEEPEAEEELGNLAFGEAATFDDGVSISVSAPAPFAPSEYSAGAVHPNNVAINITITNGSDANYEDYAYSTVTSGGAAGSQIFDSQNGITGPPSGAILPGQTISWTEAWSVADPNAIVYQIAPGFSYDNVIFTNVQ